MTHPSSNPSSSRDASTVAAASTRRFASRVDGRHTSLGHARKETTTTTTTTTMMRGTTTTTVASSSSSSLSSSTLVADARGRRAVSRCAVRRVDARREEPKIQPRRRTGTATTRETRERSSRAHRSTHASRHRHRANSVVFETPVATTKQTTRETRPAALGVRSSSRASTRRTDDDARDRRDVDAIARGRRREDENRDAEDASRDDDDDDGEDDASFRAAAAARDPAAASRDDARARDRRATPSSLPSDQASLLQEERDALRSAYELVVAERDDARAIRELARNAERDAARRLEASRRRHDARARHLRRAIDVIEHLRHGRATGEDVDDFLRACRRETERNDDDNVSHECLK